MTFPPPAKLLNMIGFQPGTVGLKQRYFNSNGQPIEYIGKEFKVIGEETN